MPDDWVRIEISRRRMLSVIAGSACYAVHFIVPQAATTGPAVHLHKPAQVATGLKSPSTGLFNGHQMDTIAALSEIIIPADGHSPGAKAAGVDQFIAEAIAASKEETQKFWTDGLAAVDKMARLEYGKDFFDCRPEQQVGLVGKISQREEHPGTLEERFFVAVKQSTVDGYYSSEVGIHQDLEYQGNTALAEFPGCTHEIHKAGPKKSRQAN
jgi:gluconate 2-dehydrogenase subunit 3-like protein